MDKRKFVLPAAIGVAAVWFGSHAGAGFATGRQEVEFFVQFGWHSVWIGVLAMLILGAAIFFGLELARIYKTHDYKSFFKKLYAPYHLIFANLWDLLYLYGTLLGAAVAIAGASDLLRQALHIPYGIAVVIIGGILLIFTIFGAGLVRSASTAMAAFIVGSLLIVTFLGIKMGASNLGNVVSQKITTVGFGKILWMAILYGSFQSILIAPIVSVSEPLKTRKHSFMAALYGFLVNGAMLTLVCIMLLSFYPAVIKENLPVYFVTTQLGHKWLYALYSLILFFALISTGVGLIFGVVKRFEASWKSETGIFKTVRIKRITICVTCLLLSAGISLFGLTAIVAKGYGSLGYAALFLNIIPLLIIAPIKIKKAKAARSQNPPSNFSHKDTQRDTKKKRQ
jgi:uncharacterized membrane protein YkvI